MSESDALLELVSPLMHPAFRARIPDRALYELPQDWFHVLSGPVYGRVPVGPEDNNLLNKGDGPPLGARMRLHGRVLDEEGRGVPNTLLEIWQANSAGRYLDDYCNRPWLPVDPNFIGAGRCLTDENGDYSFLTIRPSGYAGAEGTDMWRAAHVHFSVFGPSLANRLVTACYFEGDPLIPSDFVLRQQRDQRERDKMIAKFDQENSGLDDRVLQIAYRWDIVLRGPGATPPEEH